MRGTHLANDPKTDLKRGVLRVRREHPLAPKRILSNDIDRISVQRKKGQKDAPTSAVHCSYLHEKDPDRAVMTHGTAPSFRAKNMHRENLDARGRVIEAVPRKMEYPHYYTNGGQTEVGFSFLPITSAASRYELNWTHIEKLSWATPK